MFENLKLMFEDFRPYWRFLVSITVVVLCLLFFLIWLIETPTCSEGLRTEAKGDTRIIEIESHGEMHEYVERCIGYRGGLAHLPNCKYCNEKRKKDD